MAYKHTVQFASHKIYKTYKLGQFEHLINIFISRRICVGEHFPVPAYIFIANEMHGYRIGSKIKFCFENGVGAG